MLDVTDIGHAHQPDRWLFRNVTHTVRPGEITTVLGPNGNGKSTFLRCAAGLLRPLEGEVHGHRDAGYVPQSHTDTFAYTALDMVLMGRSRHIGVFSVPRARDEKISHQALSRVGAAQLGHRSFDTLSGGERQLVLIARAVASESRTLVLDEPCSALDLHNQGKVLALLRQLADDGLGILLTTHHPDHAREIADFALLLNGTERAILGPTREVLDDETLGQLFGVRARTVSFTDGGHTRQVVATWFPSSNEQ